MMIHLPLIKIRLKTMKGLEVHLQLRAMFCCFPGHFRFATKLIENKSDLLSRLGTVFSIVYYSVFMETETTINQLPAVTKFSTTLTQFRARLNNVNFTGYQCMNGREFLSIFTFLHTLGLVNIYINNF